ncbi:PRC-barrel domain containing protein [Haloprofundus halobius]|uniref:PRC-barrel domain containing protein n=1 Tax=Haloprofundus halobius TaxID=2876194 RepID=UPI001CCEF747|nr:PRC-barrel domain containing protein [Haloprofundus halobius]
MERTVTFTDSDEGKRVVDASGAEVGRVVDVRHGTAYVDPDPSVFETLKAKLGWEDADEASDAYPIQTAEVQEVTDDEVRLARF